MVEPALKFMNGATSRVPFAFARLGKTIHMMSRALRRSRRPSTTGGLRRRSTWRYKYFVAFFSSFVFIERCFETFVASSWPQSKARKLISRDVHIDFCLPAFRFVFFSFASLLLHIHTHATNYLKNLLSQKFYSPSRSFLTRYVRSLSPFFLDFLAGFFVQNKMASFWHWKKKYTLQRLSLS